MKAEALYNMCKFEHSFALFSKVGILSNKIDIQFL